MHVLHVLAERGFSGGENQLLATLRYLQSRGHRQTLVLDPRAAFRQRTGELDCDVQLLKIRYDYDPIAALRLRRLIRRLGPDLVHFTDSTSHKVGAVACARGRDLPPGVVTRRMDYPIKDTALRRWLYGRAVDAVVAISEGVRDAVLAVGIDPAKVHLIHEGVDAQSLGGLREPTRRAAARQELQLADTDFCGVTHASLHRRKAHDVLLAALRELRVPAGRRVVWIFGGDGPERAALTELARQLPEHVEVRIPGPVQIEQTLAAADAFCLPSRYEGLGVALLEALSAGVPCIATHVGGMKEVFTSGESGIHVAPESVEELAAALQSLLDDPALAGRIGAAGRQRGRDEFDVELMGQRTEALYRNLSSAAQRGSSAIRSEVR